MATDADPTRASRLPVVLAGGALASVAAAVVAVWAGGGAATAIPGIEDAGGLTTWGLPVARTLTDAFAVATVGALLLVAVLLPGGRRLTATQLRYLTWAAAAAGVWAVASAAALVFTLSDLFAQPVGKMLSPRSWRTSSPPTPRAAHTL